MPSTGLFRRHDAGNWIAWIYLGSGEQRQRSMRTTNRREAEVAAHKWYAEVLADTRANDGAGATLAQAWAAFKASDRFERLADSTIESHRAAHTMLAEHLGDNVDLGDLDARAIRAAFERARDEGGYAPSTLNLYLGTLRILYRVAQRRGWIESEAAAEVEGFQHKRTPPHKRPAFTTEEMDALEFYAREHERPAFRYLVPLLRWTGARRSEVLGFRVEDFDINDRLLRIRGTKNVNADREMPILDPLVPVAEDAIEAVGGAGHLVRPVRGDDEPMNPRTARAFLMRAVERCGIDKPARFGCFRRAFITWIVGVLGPDALPVIQTWIGHSDPTVTFSHYHTQAREHERALADRLDAALP